MNIANRIKEERERIGLNQEAFGAVGGVKKLAQFNYEAGKRSPDADYLEALSKIGVDVLYIITGERSKPVEDSLSADKLVLLNAYDKAPEPVRNAALAALLSGGHAPEGINTKKERKGRATPKKSKTTIVVHGKVGQQNENNHGDFYMYGDNTDGKGSREED